ncbi:MAG: NADPH-dependent ferric siderophore reductase [Alteromonadaceae bacterium]|nr:NADPH-dependent ferric siderophore reductase [Alteromonadaceae bacterium]
MRPGKPMLPTRELTVVSAQDVHPGLRRVIFDTPAFAYRPGQDLVFLLPLPDGETGRRHYTIRQRDAAGRIAVDFVMHGPTPGPDFARTARPGDRVSARGPRGRGTLDATADWHLILCDETGLPAALHIAESMAEPARLSVLAEVRDAGWEQAFPAGVSVEWIHRGAQPPGPNDLILDRLRAWPLPAGRGFAIVTGETSNVRAQRHLLLDRGFDKTQIASEGYWRPGREGGHDHVH